MPMTHGGGGKEEGGIFTGQEELLEASTGVWNFLANLITAFVNVILDTGSHH